MAQGFEIAALAGVHGGAEFETSSGEDPELQDDTAFGLMVTLDRGRTRRLDVVYLRHDSALLVEDIFQTPDDTLVSLDIDYLHVGGRVLFRPGERAQPYLGGTVGLTRIAAEDETTIRASAAFGAGVDLWATDRIGFRLDGRWWVSFIDAGAEIFCSGGCIAVGSANGFPQMTATAAIVFRFDR
ncbi:MAG: hypothetical protein ACRD2J_03430 [Thermoanaerobaculia bacterium]